MAANTYTQSGSSPVHFTFPNKSYADCVADMSPCQMNIATDRLYPVYDDHLGTEHGLLATDETSIGAEEIPFGISGGHRLEFDSDFSYSETNQRLTVNNIQISTKLLHVGDDDTYLYYPGADHSEDWVGDIEYIDIETTTPGSVGSIEFNPGEDDVDIIFNASGASNLLYLDAGNNRASFGGNVAIGSNYISNDGGNEGVSIDSNGYTTLTSTSTNQLKLLSATGNTVFSTASGTLTVTPSADAMNVWVDDFSVLGAVSEAKISLGYSLSDNNALVIGANYGGTAYGYFHIYGDSASDGLVVLDGGNVGVGLIDPDAKLEVLSTTTQQKLSYDADSFMTISVSDGSDTTVTIGESGGIRFQPTTDQTDFFQILDADGGTPIFSVDATNERVGIGESTPDCALHVKDSNIMATKFITLEADTQAYSIDVGGSGHGAGTTGYFYIYDVTNTSRRFEITSSGSAKFYGSLNVSGALTADDDVTIGDRLIMGSRTDAGDGGTDPDAAGTPTDIDVSNTSFVTVSPTGSGSRFFRLTNGTDGQVVRVINVNASNWASLDGANGSEDQNLYPKESATAIYSSTLSDWVWQDD